MSKYLLDTDHVTLHEHAHPALTQKLLTVSPNTLCVSAVTVEEVLRGRLAVLAGRLDGARRVRAYAKLVESVAFFHSIAVIAYDPACEAQFQHLASLRLRIGSQDLKIAATAITSGLTVVTRNRKDFGRIPGLVVEDWSVPAPAPPSP